MQYLYLIKCQEFYKIGIANDIKTRLAQLSTGNPFELEVLALYGFANASAVETAIHQRYSGSRKRGEWFYLDDHDLYDFEHICQLLGGVKDTANGQPTDDEIEEAEESATNLYYFNCDASGNHYVYTIDPNRKEPNGRKKRVYLWKFNDPRTLENCPDEAARWLSAHTCKHDQPTPASDEVSK